MKIQAQAQLVGTKAKADQNKPFSSPRGSGRAIRRRNHTHLHYCVYVFAICNILSGLHGLWHVFKNDGIMPSHHYISWHPMGCPRIGCKPNTKSLLDFFLETLFGLILLFAVMTRNKITFLSWMKCYWAFMLASTLSYGYHHIFGNGEMGSVLRDMITWVAHMVELFAVTYYFRQQYCPKEKKCDPESGAGEERERVYIVGQGEAEKVSSSAIRRCEEIACEFTTETEK